MFKENSLKLFFLEIPLLFNCNQKCYYCNVWSLTYPKKEIDLDYMKWVLDLYPDNLLIGLTGGEIGLLDKQYLIKIITILKKHKHVKKIQLNSNGLVRIKFPEIIPEIDYYNEHLIFDIKDQEIFKFYNIPLVNNSNCTNIIVLTENVINSFFQNFDKLRNDLELSNTYLKVMNLKSQFSVSKDSIWKLRNLIQETKFLHNIDSIFCKTKLCSLFSHSPTLDLINKQIYHCSINYELTEKADINKENIEKHIKGQLFLNSKKDYCNICNTPMCYSGDVLKDSISEKYWNRYV